MINIYSISYINNRNNYRYIFHKDFGNGFYHNSSSGNGWGDGSPFGYINGNGDSCSSNYLIKNYKQND